MLLQLHTTVNAQVAASHQSVAPSSPATPSRRRVASTRARRAPSRLARLRSGCTRALRGTRRARRAAEGEAGPCAASSGGTWTAATGGRRVVCRCLFAMSQVVNLVQIRENQTRHRRTRQGGLVLPSRRRRGRCCRVERDVRNDEERLENLICRSRWNVSSAHEWWNHTGETHSGAEARCSGSQS